MKEYYHKGNYCPRCSADTIYSHREQGLPDDEIITIYTCHTCDWRSDR